MLPERLTCTKAHARAGATIRPVVLATLCLAALVLALSAGCSRAPRRPNVVLVILDAVRRDHVGAPIPSSDGASITPNVDRLAVEGVTFTNAWANGPWTLPSHVSMLTGHLPSSHGCNGGSFRFESDAPTIAEVLGGAGYETVAFYSNPWLSDDLSGMLRGFDGQHVDPAFGLSVLSESSQGGPETLRFMRAWLEDREPDRPFLMLVNLLEPHLPYDPPASYRTRHLADLPPDDVVSVQWAHEINARVRAPESVDWERVRRLYAGDVNAADGLFGEIVRLLEANGLYDDAVVIVTSDHGENLGDHGFTDHQFGVFETLLAVPLVVRAPWHLDPGERDDPVMLIDLFPTIAELAGVSEASSQPHSRSLLGEPPDGDRFVISEYVVPVLLRDHILNLNPGLDEPWLRAAYATVRSGDIRLTVGSDGSVELRDHADPPRDRPHLEERGRALAEALSEVLPLPASPFEREDLTPELYEALRSLGYVH